MPQSPEPTRVALHPAAHVPSAFALSDPLILALEGLISADERGGLTSGPQRLAAEAGARHLAEYSR